MKKKYESVLRSIPKEDLIEFLENCMFLQDIKAQGLYIPLMILMILLIFLLILKQGVYVWICVILHLLFCLLIAFWLGRIHIESKLIFFLKHIEKYLQIKDLQDQCLSRTFKESFLKELTLPFRYYIKRERIYWISGEAIISLKFFILDSIPVFLPIIIFFNEWVKIIRSSGTGYFILYPIFLFFASQYFFRFVNFLFWNKKLKKQLLERILHNEG